MRRDLVRQVMVPRSLIPLLERYMKEMGYDYSSQALRRIILEYIANYCGLSIDELDERYEKRRLIKPVRV